MVSTLEGAAMPDTATRSGVFLAEFGGKLYVSSATAVLDRSSRIEECSGCHEIVDRRAKITCGCGSSTVWDRSSDGQPFAYRYFTPPADPNEGNYLTIVKTEAAEPMCEHWHELPITFSIP